VGSLLLIDNQISIGQFVAAEVVIILIVSSVEKVILSLDTVYETLTATEKIGQIMDMPMERQEGTEKSLTTNNQSLQFEVRDLMFRAKETTEDIIKGISFKLEAGEKVILTGKSGSGRSTLLYLISGLYNEYRGRIIVNGLPIDTMNLDRLRSYIGDSLSQQSVFHGSIYDNITLHKDVGEKHVRDIIDLVGLKEYIYHLPDDWNTYLMPEGKNLSKSIISKIIFARCLVNYPKALLLEDMISCFDEQEKERLIEYLIQGNSTVMMISEDKEIIRKFPRVIELKEGRITFDGPTDLYLLGKSN
jgi:ABC-type bacteriocin/lantibiotic exporter with double-glycine peptidase domain